MLFGYQGEEIKCLIYFHKTWSMLASGQIAFTTGSFHSKTCLTGDALALDIFLWFPLLIALSGCFLFNNQHTRRNASCYLDLCWIISAVVQCIADTTSCLIFIKNNS